MLLRSLFVESKKLRVFDFDDTLVKTTSFIYVTNKGKTRKLTPGQYAVYKEKPGDEFDFKDFQKVQNPNEIKKITSVLRRIVASSGGQGVHILTARAAFKPIRQYLKDIGINMSKIYVTALHLTIQKIKQIGLKIRLTMKVMMIFTSLMIPKRMLMPLNKC